MARPAKTSSSQPRALRHVRLVESSAAELRLAEAGAFVREQGARGDVLIVGASRGAADDLARSVAIASGATIGLHRFSVAQLAARLAAPVLAERQSAPSPYLASEAVAARATFDAMRDAALDYFEPVARTPGFPRALARTLQEVRLADVGAPALGALPLGGADLAALLERFEQQFAAASATDRAALFAAATSALASGGSFLFPSGLPPLVLLDVPIDSHADVAFVRALIEASPSVLAAVPFGDIRTLDAFRAVGIAAEVLEQTGPSDLVALRRYLFAKRRPPARERAGDVRFFSAPGEGREAVEIARRMLEEARAGVPFDEMAVFLRSPQRYVGLLEHAFTRVGTDAEEGREGIPAWFDRGTRRPHPGGRAFLALLACACEKLSARRFAEYLSLAQVPHLDRMEPPSFVLPDDELLGVLADRAADDESPEMPPPDPEADGPDQDGTAVVEGSLRAPWKWETLIVESAVIGGDPRRWHRRLDGLAREYRLRIQEESKDDPESPRARRLEREVRNLGHLRAFALPIIDRLAAWPASGTWGDWLDRFTELAPLVLRQPERVVRALADLRPMSAIGPVSLDEARGVIADRLLTLEREPQRSRYGRVFVGSPHQARGRTFRVVFVPGLAERMFPQRPREDPMLLDEEMRLPLGAGLAVQEDRARVERLQLRLAVGAARERLWLSYPRIDVGESRPRVPSFYALDVMRAITGRVPNHEDLQEQAAIEGGAGLAWPSPADPARAVDDLEHDLSVLRELLQAPDPKLVRGHAHYLLRLNDALKRSVTSRWARARAQWTPFDGITRVTSLTAPTLAAAAPRHASVFTLRAPEVRDLPVPVPALGHLPAPARRGTGAAAETGSAHPRRALSRGAGRVLPRPAGRGPAARHARQPGAGARHPRRDHGPRGRPVLRTARPGDRSRLARRDRGTRPGPARAGSAPCPSRTPGCPSTSNTASACTMTGAIREAARIRCAWMAASSCAARSISSSAGATPRRCA